MSEAIEPAPAAAAIKPAKRRLELALFAFPHAPLGALALPPIVFLPPYYAAQLGIPLEVVSALFLGARALDIIIDPILGSLQDRTRSSFGRRKIWMAVSTPILMFAVWLAFIGVGPGANVYMLGATIFTLYATFATMLIAHLGWASELRADYHGRTNALGAVQLAAMTGATLILTLPALVTGLRWGDNADAVHVMGWTVIIALPIAVLVALIFVREPDVQVHERIDWRVAMGAIFTNKHLRGVLLPDLLFGIAQGVSGGLFLFYFQYVMGYATQAHGLLLIYFISGIVGVPLWMLLGRRIGKHRALQAACVYAALVTLMLLILPHFDPSDPPVRFDFAFAGEPISIVLLPGHMMLAMLGMLIAGLHQGSSALLLRAMLADVVDADTLKTGQKRAGLFNGLMLTTSKVGLATGPITYAVLAVFGFDTALGGNNSPEAMGALNWMFIGAPAIIFLLTAASLFLYRLDETSQKALRAEIDARSPPSSSAS